MYNHLHLLENNSLKKQGKQKDKKNKKDNEHFYNSCSILIKGGPEHKTVNIKLFNNGKISLTGAKEERDGYDACIFLLQELKKKDNIFIHDKSDIDHVLEKDEINNILKLIENNTTKILNDIKKTLNKSDLKINMKNIKSFIEKEDTFNEFETVLDRHKYECIFKSTTCIDKIKNLENSHLIFDEFETLFLNKNVHNNEYEEHIQIILEKYNLDEKLDDIIYTIILEHDKNKYKLFNEIKHKLKKLKIIQGLNLVQPYKNEYKYQVYWNNDQFDDGWYSEKELKELGYSRLIESHHKKIKDYQKNIDDASIDGFSVSMINSDFKTNYRINLIKFLDILNESEKNIFIKFNPERYRGLIIGYFWNKNKEIQDGCCKCKNECFSKKKSKKLSNSDGVCKKITIAIFKTGSVIITGGNLIEQINDAYIFINDLFKKHYNQIIKLSIHDFQNEKEETDSDLKENTNLVKKNTKKVKSLKKK